MAELSWQQQASLGIATFLAVQAGNYPGAIADVIQMVPAIMDDIAKLVQGGGKMPALAGAEKALFRAAEWALKGGASAPPVGGSQDGLGGADNAP